MEPRDGLLVTYTEWTNDMDDELLMFEATARRYARRRRIPWNRVYRVLDVSAFEDIIKVSWYYRV